MGNHVANHARYTRTGRTARSRDTEQIPLALSQRGDGRRTPSATL